MKHAFTLLFLVVFLTAALVVSGQNVGIAGKNAPERLTVTGSLLVRSSIITSETEPNAAHTFNMPAAGEVNQLVVDDSAYRIYDPRGLSNYQPGDNGAYAFIDTLGSGEGTMKNGYEIIFDSIQLAPGDTIHILNFLSNTTVKKLGSSANGTRPVFAGNYLIIQFLANADANVGAGFAARVKRYFPGPGNAPTEGSYGHANLYFNPTLASLAAGFSNSATGRGAVAMGIGSAAIGESSAAIGLGSSAVGKEDMALIGGRATGSRSLAAGTSAVASGDQSMALGAYSSSTGMQSTSFSGAKAAGDYSVALHFDSEANGAMSTALAGGISNGMSSVAMGRNAKTSAAAFASMAIGDGAEASGEMAMALGKNAKAVGNGSVAIGENSNALLPSSIAIGGGTTNSLAAVAIGVSANAAGFRSTAIGTNTYSADWAHAIGNNASAATYGFAFGNNVSASNSAVAIGHGASAGSNAYAFGRSISATGIYSTALGNYVSTSGYEGAFVIGDNSTTTTMQSFVANGFRARFAQGYRLFTNSAATVGAALVAGANSWAAMSDVRLKENFLPVNGESFLQKIESMPLTTWNYKVQDAATYRHYGPMAQDFYAAFGRDDLGTIGCDTLINQQDFAGVNLIAIQALIKRTALLQQANASLEKTNNELRSELTGLKDELKESNEIINRKLRLLDELIVEKKTSKTSNPKKSE